MNLTKREILFVILSCILPYAIFYAALEIGLNTIRKNNYEKSKQRTIEFNKEASSEGGSNATSNKAEPINY